MKTIKYLNITILFKVWTLVEMMFKIILAKDDVIVGISAEEGGGVVIICIAVCLWTMCLIYLVRIVHVPLVRSACGWETTARVPAAVLICVKLHAGRVASNHPAGTINGQF